VALSFRNLATSDIEDFPMFRQALKLLSSGLITFGVVLAAPIHLSYYSKCHVTSNKAKSNLECAEVKFQTRGWVRGCDK
jgi:hypothetical protein